MAALSRLDGKIALVTRSSRGLGWEIAHGLARAGARVLVHGRDRTRIDAAIAELRDEGLLAEAFIVDLMDDDDLRSGFTELSARHGRIDILVNNAGGRDRHLQRSFPDLVITDQVIPNMTGVLLAELALTGRACRVSLRRIMASFRQA